MCVYICLCTCVCVLTHTQMHASLCMCLCVYICACVCLYVRVLVQMSTYVYGCIEAVFDCLFLIACLFHYFIYLQTYSPNLAFVFIYCLTWVILYYLQQVKSRKIYSAIVDEQGTWKVLLEPESSAGPFSIVALSEGKAIHLNDVLFGDVWLCSGQSNMAFTLDNVSVKVKTNIMVFVIYILWIWLYI